MISTTYVFDRIDPISQMEVRHAAQSAHFILFLQAMVKDCELQLCNLDYKNKDKLFTEYNNIIATRNVYEDLVQFLSKLTVEEDN